MRVIAPFLAAALLVTGAPAFAQDARVFIEKGDEYVRAFENVKAVAEYEQAHRLAPESYEALVKLSRACRDAGEQLKAQGSKDAERYFEQGVRYAEALKQSFPDRAEPYYYAATNYGHLALYRGGKAKVRLSREIEKNAKKAIEVDPAFVPPYVTLGVFYREVANANAFMKAIAKTILGGLPDGTNEDSERMLRKAIELAPADVYAHFELASTYEKMKRKDRAVEELKKVLDLPATAHRDARLKAEARKKLDALEAH
jgi:tetratricopeptide (TPR) repeat protein